MIPLRPSSTDISFNTVPPLENFVMNRVLGDYMETMLYKVFVSIDEETSVREVQLHQQSIFSFYCILQTCFMAVGGCKYGYLSLL